MPVLYSEVTARADVRREAADGAVVPPLTVAIRPLRPLVGSEPLDLGITMFRALARTLVPVAVLLYLPIEAVDLWWRLRSGNAQPIALAGMPMIRSQVPGAHGILVAFAHAVALSMLGLMTGMLLGAALEHRPVRISGLLAGVIKRIPVAVVITLIAVVAQIVMACVPLIGFVVAGTVTSTASIAAGAERLGPFGAVRRSSELARASARFAGGLFIGGLVVVWIVRIILFVGPLGLVAVMGLPEAALSIVANLSAVAMIVLQPLTAAMAAAAYLALRIRSEGLDLVERIATVGEAD